MMPNLSSWQKNLGTRSVIALFLVSVLSGCLYSTQRLNTGLLLPAGKSEATLSGGYQTLWRCADYQNDSATGKRLCNADASGQEKVTSLAIFKGGIDYRLGLRDHFGPFPGVELQWHLEVPTNPLSMEFALNLALPAPVSWHHALGLGWGVGAWAGNSYSLEYALSRNWGSWRPFGNMRATYLATQIGEVLEGNFSQPLPYHPRWVFQSGAGLRWEWPNWILAPDYVIPALNLTWPQIPSGEQKFKREDIPALQWDFHLGLGWGF